MRLLWVGGPTARIEVGSFRLLTDPMLSQGPEAAVLHLVGPRHTEVARAV